MELAARVGEMRTVLVGDVTRRAVTMRLTALSEDDSSAPRRLGA